MPDLVFQAFLERQKMQASGLNAAGSLVNVAPIPSQATLPQHYLLDFRCKGLIRTAPGKIVEAEQFSVGVFFPAHYLRKPCSFESLTWLAPLGCLHPNIAPPFICVGDAFMSSSPGLVEIVHQLHQMITFAKFSTRDALNGEAAQWARRNLHRFPVDRRPLRGRRFDIQRHAATKEEVRL